MPEETGSCSPREMFKLYYLEEGLYVSCTICVEVRENAQGAETLESTDGSLLRYRIFRTNFF